MKHIISVLVENKPGVLTRISGLFSARGFNIDSLAVGETHDPSISRMTIVVNAKDEKILEQIKKQLNKLIDTISIIDLTKREFIERELILIKLEFESKEKSKLESLAKKFGAHILFTPLENFNKVKGTSLTGFTKGKVAIIEISAEKEEINNFLKELENFKIKELVRTGRIAVDKH